MTLTTAIYRRYNVDEATIINRGRINKLSKVRQLIAYFSLKTLRVSLRKIETHLKAIQSSISKLVREGQNNCWREKLTLVALLEDR